jgi:hypothetical protein
MICCGEGGWTYRRGWSGRDGRSTLVMKAPCSGASAGQAVVLDQDASPSPSAGVPVLWIGATVTVLL